MHRVSEFCGICKSAARISASAVSNVSSQAERMQFQICFDPEVLVSQKSFLHLSSSCFERGVSYAGVFLMPSPENLPVTIVSTFWFDKY